MTAPDTDNPPATAGGLRELLVVNQAIGPVTRELLEDLAARGVRCKALTGWIDTEHPERLPFEVLPAAPLVKHTVWRRMLSWGTFTWQAMRCIAANRSMPVLVTSNPPWVMLAMPLLKRLFGVRYVLRVLDIYPDVLERMGIVRTGGLIAGVWRRLSRRAMLGAEGVITLGGHMARTLEGHLRSEDLCRIAVLPDWVDTDVIRPLAKADNPFAVERGLVDKMVVMYSGAFGATHDTGSILEAAERLRDVPDVRFVLIGGGTRQREVSEEVSRRKLANLALLPLQPLSMVPYTLASADCAIVCLDEGFEGVSVPSKTYYAMAAGAALLAVGAPETELADLALEGGCGVHLPPRRPDLLAEAILALHADRAKLERLKAAARATAVERFSRRRVTAAHAAAFDEWLGGGEPKACDAG